MFKKYRDSKFGCYALMVAATAITAIGIYFFKFPNDFCFGGVTGIAVIFGKLTPWSPGIITLVLNLILLIIGFAFLGNSFGVKTVFSSILLSGMLWVLEAVYPMQRPLTNQPVLEIVFAILFPSLGSAVLFNIGASGGGTDIVAKLLENKFGTNIGVSLLIVDTVIVGGAFFVFDIQTGLFSLVGLMVKTFAINSSIENINLHKYFNIISRNPKPICDFINQTLHRGATVSDAIGAFTNEKRYIILTVLSRNEAIQLRNHIKTIEPQAFMTITNSSEIIGRGFK